METRSLVLVRWIKPLSDECWIILIIFRRSYLMRYPKISPSLNSASVYFERGVHYSASGVHYIVLILKALSTFIWIVCRPPHWFDAAWYDYWVWAHGFLCFCVFQVGHATPSETTIPVHIMIIGRAIVHSRLTEHQICDWVLPYVFGSG